MDNINVYVITPEQWRPHSEEAHLICFGKHKPAERDRIDFVIMAQRGNELLGFITCREHDNETLYWQYGGAFPSACSSVMYKSLLKMASLANAKYKKVYAFIENSNVIAIKLAMKLGFRATGIKYSNETILIEHTLTEVL